MQERERASPTRTPIDPNEDYEDLDEICKDKNEYAVELNLDRTTSQGRLGLYLRGRADIEDGLMSQKLRGPQGRATTRKTRMHAAETSVIQTGIPADEE